MNSFLRVIIVWIGLLAGTSILSTQASHWMDTRQSGLNGPVQTVTEEQMLLQPEAKEWVKIPLRNIVYNKDGYAVRVRLYRGAYDFEDKGYLYDGQGRVVGSGSFNKEGIFSQEMLNRYNTEGNLEESRYFSRNGTLFLIKQYLYQQGKVVKETHLGADGSVIAVKQYEYDVDGQQLGIITVGQDGKVLAKEALGNAGRVTDCQYSGELADYGRRIKIRTEAEGRIGEICYLPDGSVYQNQVCEVREGDTVKRTVHRGDGTVASETVYNAVGDMISLSRYMADGSLETEEKISYQYDAWGNWTERTVAKRDNPRLDWRETEKTFRQITYFKD